MATKVDVSQQLYNFKGDQINIQDEPAELRDILIMALTQLERGEQVKAKEQFERYSLASKINGRDEIEFSSAEVSMLQERVAKFFAPLITGQVYLILEGKDDSES